MGGSSRSRRTQRRSPLGSIELYYPLLNYSVVEKEKELQLPHDYQYSDAKPDDVISPAVMFGEKIDLENYRGSPIEAYAEWLTSPDNPTFTRVIANRLWKKAFGIGVFEPVDDLTDLAKPSNPQLMSYLEELMRQLNYDMRAYLEILFTTKAWQRAVDQNEIFMGQTYHFPGPTLRRMSAEQIWDSLVALAVSEADRYRPLLKSQLASVDRERLMWTSLEGRTLDELIELFTTLSPMVNEKRAAQERISREMIEAQRNGDKDRLGALKEESKDEEARLRRAYAEIGYIDLHNARTAEQLLNAKMGLTETTMSSMTESMSQGRTQVLTSLPEIQLPEMPEGLKPHEQHEWRRAQQRDLRNFKGLISRMARASELEMPAPRGHFLRDFGQSDREVIENAAVTASVPQALNLLNGPMVEALTNRFAVFGSRIHTAGSHEEKTRMIFQAMLTREPTLRELEIVGEEIQKNETESYRGIVWALLNTQQFRFIQ